MVPGSIESINTHTGQCGVAVSAIGVTFLANSIDNVISTPADTCISTPSCIYTVFVAVSIGILGVPCTADTFGTTPLRIGWTLLANSVDDVLEGNCALASAYGCVPDCILRALLVGSATAAGEDETRFADASSSSCIVLAVGNTGKATCTSGVVSGRTDTDSIADHSSNLITDYTSSCHCISNLRMGADTMTAVPDQLTSASPLRNAYIVLHVIPIIASTLSKRVPISIGLTTQLAGIAGSIERIAIVTDTKSVLVYIAVRWTDHTVIVDDSETSWANAGTIHLHIIGSAVDWCPWNTTVAG